MPTYRGKNKKRRKGKNADAPKNTRLLPTGTVDGIEFTPAKVKFSHGNSVDARLLTGPNKDVVVRVVNRNVSSNRRKNGRLRGLSQNDFLCLQYTGLNRDGVSKGYMIIGKYPENMTFDETDKENQCGFQIKEEEEIKYDDI